MSLDQVPPPAAEPDAERRGRLRRERWERELSHSTHDYAPTPATLERRESEIRRAAAQESITRLRERLAAALDEPAPRA